MSLLLSLPSFPPCPTLHPSPCQGPANFILIGHVAENETTLADCPHPFIHASSLCSRPCPFCSCCPPSHLSRCIHNFTPVLVALSPLRLLVSSLSPLISPPLPFLPICCRGCSPPPVRLSCCSLTSQLCECFPISALPLVLTLHSARQNK